MITLKKVDEDNFYKVIKLEVDEQQSKYVARNIYSLAQAWLYHEEARPYAILNDDEVVGFMMLDWDEEERECGIWRFMIAKEHQRKGYGRKALECVLNMIKESDKFDIVDLDYVPENTVAKDLYASFGFRETGEMEGDEVIAVLKLTEEAK